MCSESNCGDFQRRNRLPTSAIRSITAGRAITYWAANTGIEAFLKHDLPDVFSRHFSQSHLPA